MLSADAQESCLLARRSAHALLPLCVILWLSAACVEATFFQSCRRQGGMHKLLLLASLWWNGHTLGVEKTAPAPLPENPPVAEPAPQAAPANAVAEGSCQVPRETEQISCTPGAGLLCVNTPNGGTATDLTVLKGTLDRSQGLVALTVTVQHEYRHRTWTIDTSHPIFADCWNENSAQSNYCIDPEGRFTIPLSLAELGPYTVALEAQSSSGARAHQEVRVSRVLPVDLKKAQVKLDPDVLTQQQTSEPYVALTMQLLNACESCDFIGAGTQAIEVQVESTVTDGEQQRLVRCATRIEQGGAGHFRIGVPVFRGKNKWKVSACNAANHADCSLDQEIIFTGQMKDESLRFLSETLPNYDAAQYPQVPLSFQFGESSGQEPVKLLLNHDPEIPLDPDPSGVFTTNLVPQPGINVLTIVRGEQEIPWTFGWGKLHAPADSKDEQLPAGLGVGLSKHFLEKKLFPVLSHFLESDNFSVWLQELLEPKVSSEKTPDENGVVTPVSIPKCSEQADDGASIALRGKPKIGKIKLLGAQLKNQQLDFSVDIDDLRVDLNLVAEDKEPLPLFVSMKKAVLDFSLQQKSDGSKSLWLLSSPHTDCDFKQQAYCSNIPASLIPQNYVGNASEWHHFVMCDVAQASSKVKELCESINTLNGQTGVLQVKVLDGLNEQLYCKGSQMITAALQQAIPLQLNDFIEKEKLDLSAFNVGLDVSQLKLASNGVQLLSKISLGQAQELAPELNLPSIGWLSDPNAQAMPLPQNTAELEAVLSLDLVNQLLFAFNSVLSYDFDEESQAKSGFDFHAQCDNVEKPAELCQMRPRVQNLLGSALTSYGYFPADYPLMLNAKPHPALSPHIRFLDAQTVEVQVGGAEISFYALDAEKNADDVYQVKHDADGKPMILSMRPEDPDPRHGPIIRFDFSALLVLKLGAVQAAMDGAGQSTGELALPVSIVPEQSRFVLSAIPSSNATSIPAVSLVTGLKQQLPIAIKIFSEKAFFIPLPKAVQLPIAEESLLTRLGLREISWGERGFGLELLPASAAVRVQLDPNIRQELPMNAHPEQWNF